jgi:hypothetical protein
MISKFSAGFSKKLTYMAALPAIATGAFTGTGLGLLSRAAFEEKFKDTKDKTIVDKAIASGPVLGFILGSAVGSAVGAKNVGKWNRMLGFTKGASLNSNISLKPHQSRAIEQLENNNGSLLVAHATGSGKTLTGIAGFEKLKESGKASRAVVVVPAALRENFVKNLKEFTNSTYSVYGPKGENKTKNIGDASNKDYNIVSYELFREHGDKVLADTKADTIIMDEVHRARGTEGVTYSKLLDLRKKVKNAITLTGSVVNNEPNDIVPLLDITYTPSGHKLVSKKFFDKVFVQKDAKTYGWFNPKVSVVKGLKNKSQLSSYLRGKVDFISHKDLEKDLPGKEVETKEIEMTPSQKKLYDFTLSSVDPVTRWKIRNNIPVSQREARDTFSKLLQARQVATDPSVLDKRLVGKNPIDYSPKVKAIIADAEDHLKESPTNKTVIFGNLLHHQVNAVEEGLKAKNIPYAKFIGLGNEGQTAKTRPLHLEDFQSGKKRVLLISGAGAEGLDLKNTTMLQMAEGHFNPERIHQAESRIRRLGSFGDDKNKKVLIKRYISKPAPTGFSKVLDKVYSSIGLGGGTGGVDKWIYNIAEKKDKLNDDFRDVLQKEAETNEERFNRGFNSLSENSDIDALENHLDSSPNLGFHAIGESIGTIPSGFLTKGIERRGRADLDAVIKQKLLNRGLEELTTKRHFDKILAESKTDERMLDATLGMGALATGIGLLPVSSARIQKANAQLGQKITSVLTKVLPKVSILPPGMVGSIGSGMLLGLATKPILEIIKNKITQSVIRGDKDLDIGIQKYLEKLEKKVHRKYKTSKSFVNEYDTREDLGIKHVGM